LQFRRAYPLCPTLLIDYPLDRQACPLILKLPHLPVFSIIGKVKYPWMDIDYVLAQFGSTRRQAFHGYRKFMSEEVGKDQLKELRGGGLIRSQGRWSQVMSMRRRGQKEAFKQRP